MAEYKNSIRKRKMIRGAFAQLVKEKQDISKITVKEIVERSEISKSTFYCHYSDIYAVFEEFGTEIINIMNTTLDALAKHNRPEDIREYAKQLIKTLLENEDLYRKLLTSDLTYTFIDKLKNLFIEKLDKNQNIDYLSKDPSIRRIEINLIANAIIYTFVDFFKSDDKLGLKSLEDISSIVDDLISNLKNLDY